MAQSPPSNAIPHLFQGQGAYRWDKACEQLTPAVLGTTRTERKAQKFKLYLLEWATSIGIPAVDHMGLLRM